MQLSLTNSKDIVAHSGSRISDNYVINISGLFYKKNEAADGSVGIPSGTVYNSVKSQFSSKTTSADVYTK